MVTKPFYAYILLLAFVLASVNGNSKRIPFIEYWLGVMVLVEFVILDYYAMTYGRNTIVANSYALASIVFFLNCFSKVSFANKLEGFLLIANVTWMVFALWKILTSSISSPLFGYTYVVGLFLVSIHILRYITYIIDESAKTVLRQPRMYLGIGVLIFFVSSFPILLFLNVLVANEEATKAYLFVLQVGNLFLSLGYLGAAICMRKEA